MVAVLENETKVMGNEYEFGDFTLGRYAWILANVQRIDPGETEIVGMGR
ncbi:hypothetical protein [Pelosinus fermentans]|nr:hypothetical protein [Pelosinus fermentans]